MKTKPFPTKTYHVIFDAFNVKAEMLNDDIFIFKIMSEIPRLIGMKILSGPNLVRDYDKKNPGLSCFEIIDFSHISIHTFTKTQEIYVDVFSCKKFDYEMIYKYLHKILKVKPEQVEYLKVLYPWEKQ